MRFRNLLVSSLALTAVSATMVACGDSTDDASGLVPTSSTTAASTTAGAIDPASVSTAPMVTVWVPPKPEVQIPDAIPTELVITDLVDGEGRVAESGDTVVVHYVGVRSEDGTEFDNSYERGQSFPVVLGSGGVIAGWDEGLLGVKQGGQRQLDIPSALAYGAEAKGDVIKANDALTFVIDIIAVIGVSDPADAPTLTIEGAENRDKIDIEDIIIGEGEEIQPGQTAVVQIIAYRGDTGAQLNSTWEIGQPVQFTFASGEILPGLELGIDEMNIGGRRKVIVPFILAFGEAGSPEAGLPANTDMVLVIDLIAGY